VKKEGEIGFTSALGFWLVGEDSELNQRPQTISKAGSAMALPLLWPNQYEIVVYLPIYVFPEKLLYIQHILLRQTKIHIAADIRAVGRESEAHPAF
jgi:hypothetical protein